MGLFAYIKKRSTELTTIFGTAAGVTQAVAGGMTKQALISSVLLALLGFFAKDATVAPPALPAPPIRQG